ncbi:MAG TPA: ATP-binding protein, partial [Gemmatimonadaceae bacterium]|nr:ATP-binding protein [Gemmatimonadaceae bacterium]
HPNPVVAADVRRALASRALVITGPIPILQGGTGLLVRLAVGGPPGRYPELVNIILDLPPLLEDAGLGAASVTRVFQLRDRDGRVVAGVAEDLPDPERVAVNTGDGEGELALVPTAGWGATFARERRLVRIAEAVIVLLVVGVAGLLADRQRRLQRAVLERTLALRTANADLEREVAERRAAEQALAMRAAELRVALGTGQMGVWAWDVTSGYIAWSEGTAALFGGVTPPDSYEALLALLDPDDRASLHDAVRAALEHGEAFRVQYRVHLEGSSETWLYATAELQRDDAGNPRRLLGVVMDVTSRVMLERQLRQAQKMEAVGTLAGGIAHDFNNLLTAILGFARLADESLADATATPTPRDASVLRDTTDAVRADLGELVRAAERASLLTAQLLAFSRQQVVRPTILDVNAIVIDLQTLLGRLLDERITLQVDLSPDALGVRADAGQLSQVLLNLVLNARDAIAAHGRITIGTRRLPADRREGLLPDHDGPIVEIRVQDDGAGMSAEVRDRIFEPFFTTKVPGKGTGLGLSTAWGIVTQAGGVIHVESAPGEGTCMR